MTLFKTIIVLLLGIGGIYLSFIKDMMIVPLIMSIVAIIIKANMYKKGEKNFFLPIGSYAGAITIGFCIVRIIVLIISK